MTFALVPSGSLDLQRTLAEASMTEACGLLDTDVPSTRDAGGATIPGEPVARVMRHAFCRFSPVGADGRERVVADQLQALDLLRVRLPWDQTVEPTDQFTARGQTFEIVQVDPVRTSHVDRSIYVREGP